MQTVMLKDLDVNSLSTELIQVKESRRGLWIYRAQGGISPCSSSSCHIAMVLTEKEQIVPEPEEVVPPKKKISQEKLKKRTLTAQE